MNEEFLVDEQEGIIKLPIRLSKLLKRLQKNNNVHYICHAANKIFKKKTGIKSYRALPDQTFVEFKRILPNYIRKRPNSLSLAHWTKNLPTHLKEQGSLPDDARQFRIEFLTWVIQKYGDMELMFHFTKCAD